MTDHASAQPAPIISLQPCDLDLVQQVAQQRGLGIYELDTALGLIIREWVEMQEELPCAIFPVTNKHSSA